MKLSKKMNKAGLNWEEDGASSVEYAILAVFIAAVIVTAVSSLGTATREMFERLLP